jgi:hypothetical protein
VCDRAGEELASLIASHCGLRFQSTLRTVADEELGMSYDFVNAFFLWQRAFVPAFGLSLVGAVMFETGERVCIGIDGLNAEDFERCDFIALAP